MCRTDARRTQSLRAWLAEPPVLSRCCFASQGQGWAERSLRRDGPMRQCCAWQPALKAGNLPGAAAVASGPSRQRPPAHFTMSAPPADSCVCMRGDCGHRALPREFEGACVQVFTLCVAAVPFVKSDAEGAAAVLFDQVRSFDLRCGASARLFAFARLRAVLVFAVSLAVFAFAFLARWGF